MESKITNHVSNTAKEKSVLLPLKFKPEIQGIEGAIPTLYQREIARKGANAALWIQDNIEPKLHIVAVVSLLASFAAFPVALFSLEAGNKTLSGIAKTTAIVSLVVGTTATASAQVLFSLSQPKQENR